MSPISKKTILISLSLILLVNGIISSQTKTTSSIDELKQFEKSLAEKCQEDLNDQEYNTIRKELALKHLARITSAGQTSEELFAYASLLNAAGKIDEADELMQQLAGKDDVTARHASKFILDRLTEAERWQELSEKIEIYYKRFPASPNDNEHLYYPVYHLATYLKNHVNKDKALAVILMELGQIDMAKAPFLSVSLLADFHQLFQRTGNLELLRKILAEKLAKLQVTLEKRKKLFRPDSIPFEKYLVESQKTRKYEHISHSLSLLSTRINIVGKKSPDIRISHFGRRENPSGLLEAGRVSVICFLDDLKDPFLVHLNRLAAQHKKNRIVFIALFSLQDTFIDSEGWTQDLEKIRPVTAHFNSHFPALTPAFTPDSVYDDESGIEYLPGILILDHDGHVVLPLSGAEADDIPMVERCLQELMKAK